MNSRRAESFSDGVFAVAITILVFNLLPIAEATDNTQTGLTARTLGHYWPAYLAYVVSFLTIGIMWLNHHTLLAQVRRVSRGLLLLNLILLMGIVALPFPTALLADHLVGAHARHGQATVAAVTYGLFMIFISVSFGTMWTYMVAHQHQLGSRRPLRQFSAATLRFTAGNLGYLAAPLVALASPVGALIIYGLLAGYYMIEHLPVPAEDEEEAADEASVG